MGKGRSREEQAWLLRSFLETLGGNRVRQHIFEGSVGARGWVGEIMRKRCVESSGMIRPS